MVCRGSKRANGVTAGVGELVMAARPIDMLDFDLRCCGLVGVATGGGEDSSGGGGGGGSKYGDRGRARIQNPFKWIVDRVPSLGIRPSSTLREATKPTSFLGSWKKVETRHASRSPTGKEPLMYLRKRYVSQCTCAEKKGGLLYM